MLSTFLDPSNLHSLTAGLVSMCGKVLPRRCALQNEKQLLFRDTMVVTFGTPEGSSGVGSSLSHSVMATKQQVNHRGLSPYLGRNVPCLLLFLDEWHPTLALLKIMSTTYPLQETPSA